MGVDVRAGRGEGALFRAAGAIEFAVAAPGIGVEEEEGFGRQLAAIMREESDRENSEGRSNGQKCRVWQQYRQRRTASCSVGTSGIWTSLAADSCGVPTALPCAPEAVPFMAGVDGGARGDSVVDRMPAGSASGWSPSAMAAMFSLTAAVAFGIGSPRPKGTGE